MAAMGRCHRKVHGISDGKCNLQDPLRRPPDLSLIHILAETGDLEGLKSYLEKTISRIPNLGIHFGENRAADSVIGYYCALAKREDIPFCAKLDLPQTLPCLLYTSVRPSAGSS